VAFQYYNTNLLDVCDTSNGEEIVTFMDDTLLLACTKTLSEANSKLHSMMERQQGGLEWSQAHQCEFAIDKFGVMGFSRRREPNLAKRPLTMLEHRLPIFLRGIKIPAINVHKFLGVLIDQELHWKDQVNYALQKGSMWVMQYHWLARPLKGVSAKYMRRLYTSVSIPRMLYMADLFLIPETDHSRGTKGPIKRLSKIQWQASLHITGALRSAPMGMIDACADLLPFLLLINKVTHRAAMRLAILPSSHPLTRHIGRAAGRYIK